MIPRSQLPSVLQAELGLTPCEAAIVARLWRAGPSCWVSTGDLNAATADASRMAPYREGRLNSTIRVHVWAIRLKLGADFVLSHNVHGWTLGALGVTTLRGLVASRRSVSA